MSDKGIFILETKGPEFRVTLADSSIEDIFGNFDKDANKWKGNREAIKEHFGECPIHKKKDSAVEVAIKLIKEINIKENDDEFEFGICNISDFKDSNFNDLV